MFRDCKSFWEMGSIKKRIGYMIYIIKGSQFTHKGYLNQIRKFLSDKVDSGHPEEKEAKDVIYDTFDIKIPQAAPGQPRLKRKKKMIDFMVVNPKSVGHGSL